MSSYLSLFRLHYLLLSFVSHIQSFCFIFLLFSFPAGPEISTGTTTHTTLPLTCPAVPGDYVLLYWRPPDLKNHNNMTIVHHYDRWRNSTIKTEKSKKLQLAGQPYNKETGSFSFLLTPAIKDGGLYICDVYLNDVAFSQRTLLSILKGRDQY